ncbi:hypothetical protein Tco_1476757 [Tanacetum coccineum]
MRSFVMELDVNVVAWNHLVNGMLFNLIKNLYVSFGIPFDLKQYYKDGDCTRMLRRPRVKDLAERIRMVYTRDDGQEVFVSHAWRRLFRIRSPLVQEFILEFFCTCRIKDEMGLDVAGDGRGQIWCILVSERLIPDKGDLSDYWVEIYSGRNFLRGAPSYTYIRDLVRRNNKGRKSIARLSRGHFVGLLAHLFGDDWGWVASGPERQQVAAAGAPKATKDAPEVDQGAQAHPTPIQVPQLPPPPPTAGRIMPQRLGRLEEEIQELRSDVRSLYGLVDRSMTDQGRVSTWMISCMCNSWRLAGRLIRHLMLLFEVAPQLFLRDVPNIGLARPALPQ